MTADRKTLASPLRRTRRWAFVWMLLTLASGLGATALVARIIRGRTAYVLGATDAIVVAAGDVPGGTTLDGRHVRVVRWPKSSIPEGAFRDAGLVIGRVAVETLVAGEPLLDRRIAPRESGAGVGALVPAEMRAMTVRVNDEIGVAGFIHKNDLVDVIAVLRSRDGQERDPRSQVILQRVRVLSAGDDVGERDPKRPEAKQVSVVTLLVTPDDAQRLALAAEEGKIRLALRNPVDLGRLESAGISVGGLIGTVPAVAPAPAAAAAPPPPPPVAAAPPPPPARRHAHEAEHARAEHEKERPADGAKDAHLVEVFHGRTLEERKIRLADDAEQAR